MATAAKHKQRSHRSYRKDASARDSYFSGSVRLSYSRQRAKLQLFSLVDSVKRFMRKHFGRND